MQSTFLAAGRFRCNLDVNYVKYKTYYFVAVIYCIIFVTVSAKCIRLYWQIIWSDSTAGSTALAESSFVI